MQLGFVSAILPDQTLEEVLETAKQSGYDCVELMCWPPGKANRRYAGVTHLDVSNFTAVDAEKVHALCSKHDISISGLGYYPNPLDPDPELQAVVVEHLKKVITAASLLQLPVVNTFIGRDWKRSIDEQWETMKAVWRPIVDHAESCGIRIAIENCPMIFGPNEWPGGKNLANTPQTWRRLFAEFPQLGLNFDPSHLVWQMIDIPRAIREFGSRIIHVHAKDARIDADDLYEQGVMGHQWHTPKLPGMGDVNWGAFFGALTDAGFQGAVCVEVEDRVFEKTLEDRKRSLVLSQRFLSQYVA
ncbi:MAG: sugar phosphate isomerase/epimerase [Planctomycetia bacterium]|nr:sugar phosphate isomerase/epimerase [Planctomycetia bacterium]